MTRIIKSGFTLVELSIVLVVIGLIIGGVLVGRDLIRAAEIRSVISDVERFTTAAKTFRAKFNCLPGDCADASAQGLGADGNGNGSIDEGWCASTPDTSTAGNVELFLFWQHLAGAQLIPGSFTGQPGPSDALEAIVKVNVPPSKMTNGGYSIANITASAGVYCAPYVFTNADYNNYLNFGAQSSVGDLTDAPILTPADAFSTDQKIDDGKPGTGHVLTLNSSWYSASGYGATNCVTSDNPSTATYNVSYMSPACHLIFNKAF
jgi:prepilin-type N-terminal cleavage/methylation domain-containing protein